VTERIGKFELVRVLGKGASATVHLAVDTFSGQEVALKVLGPKVLADPEFGSTYRKLFLNEASLAGKLSHPHIASILDAVVEERSGYLAIEYVAGGNLLRFTTPESLLPVEDAIEIAFKCCGALDYAFRQGIVHRDIKPANIMRVAGTTIKITDFGAAYLQRAQATQVADIGSPLYMSPEQILGKELDYKSDMFAFGAVLYELFSGRQPFTGPTLSEIFRRIVRADPPAPSTVTTALDPTLDPILLRMLAKSPGDRYPSWADLALDLAGAGRLSVFQQAVPDREKFVALRKIVLFAALGDAEIWELAHAGRWRRVASRSVIVRENEPGKSLFLLGSGEAKVTRQERLLYVLREGEYFGDIAYIKAGAMPRQATVESITDVLLAEFEAAAVERLSERCRLHFNNVLLHTLADRLALADARIAQAAG